MSYSNLQKESLIIPINEIKSSTVDEIKEPQQKVNNPGFSSFMPDHMQDYMKELYDICNRANQNQKKDDT